MTPNMMPTGATPMVSKEKLEIFYRRVRPGGFWSILDKDVRELPGRALGVNIIVDVIGRVLLCYGISLAIGNAILLEFAKSAMFLALAVLGGTIVYWWYRKEVGVQVTVPLH